ncbi:glycosyltransferase [Thalassolituus oleivorans]|uniref:glycosyltransferase n=1 Tax=Thalassolituus oleivorans TaxID=187493 RepID=UPI0023EF8EAB|nr:glycosyltransferase [Thalassolituus oleivorans]
MKVKRFIYILHPGKANYPEIAAYTSYFQDAYDVYSGTVEDYERFDKKSECILWCIMGLYRKPLEAKFVIHDYRSLSVGAMPWLKDAVKKYLNVKPDLRIFQNQEMKNVMAFSDGITSILLPMGVPDYIYDIKPHSDVQFHQKFCYIGEMSRERGFDKVLDAYVKNYSEDKLVLIGTPEEYIFEKYSNFSQLMFLGRKPQEETLSIVKACEYAVCYFPYHRPHKFQAPTKLLEYMAMGCRVVCNDSPSNIREINRFSYDCILTKSKVFTDVSPFLDSRSEVLSVEGLGWDEAIRGSMLELYLL